MDASGNNSITRILLESSGKESAGWAFAPDPGAPRVAERAPGREGARADHGHVAEPGAGRAWADSRGRGEGAVVIFFKEPTYLPVQFRKAVLATMNFCII